MGRDPKPSPQSRQAEVARSRAEGNGPPSGSSLVALEGAAPCDAAIAEALAPFLLRTDGWLRISPQDDGATVYFKWKWTGGKHSNHYVMTVYPQSQSAEALRRLAMKVHAVDSGIQPPVKDHYFKG